MTQLDLRPSPFAALALLLLAACGGGGSTEGEDIVPITPGNAAELAAVVRSVADLLEVATLGSGLVETGASPIPGGRGGSEVVGCTGGGTVTYTFADVHPTGALSAGDELEVRFDACEEGATTTDGAIAFVIEHFSETEAASTLACSFMGGFEDPQQGMTLEVDGQIGEAVELDRESGDVGLSLSGSFRTSYGQGASALSMDVSELELGYDSFAEPGIEALRFDCTFESSASTFSIFQWDLTVRTLEDFVSYGPGARPTEGRASISSDQHVLYVSAEPDGVHLLLELDQLADGSIDWTDRLPWDELGSRP